jgi:pimeloyl-ACP methyl ester carboxylesterase
MKAHLFGAAFAAMLFGASAAGASPPDGKPTIVLVHGAFADGSSWNGVAERLERDGFPVVAVANPLRSVRADANYVADILAGIGGPTVLVGHSYGGSVISEAVGSKANVKALVYVSAFAPEIGESVSGLACLNPGSTLEPALAAPVHLSTGGSDLYIRQEKFAAQFAADVPAAEARLMAAAQRPVAEAALTEKATDAAWKRLPSWFVYGEADRNIPPATIRFMAERAHAREAIAIPGGSHVVMVSHPDIVAEVIERAAADR